MTSICLLCLLSAHTLGANAEQQLRVALHILNASSKSSSDVEKAVNILREVEKSNAPDDRMYVYIAIWKLAYCEGLLGNHSKAISKYEDLVSKLKNNAQNESGILVDLYYELGELYLKEWQIDKARKSLQEAVKYINKPVAFFIFKEKELPLFQKTRVDLLLLDCDLLSNTIAFDEQYKQCDLLAKRIENTTDKNGMRWAGVEKDLLAVQVLARVADVDSRSSNLRRSLKHYQQGLNKLASLSASGNDLVYQIEFALRLQICQNLRKLTFFSEAHQELDKAELVLKKISQARLQAELDNTRASVVIEEANFKYEEDRGDKELLSTVLRADKHAEAALAACRSLSKNNPDIATAIALFNTAQVYELRSRISAPLARVDVQKYNDEALARCKESLQQLSKILASEHDLVLQIRRLQAKLLAESGELPLAKKEAAAVLKAFAAVHGPDDIGVMDFHLLMQNIEDRLGNTKEAWQHALEHRRLSTKLMGSYLASFPPSQVVRWFRYWDDPSLRASLQLAMKHSELAPSSAEVLLNGKAKIAEVIAQINHPDNTLSSVDKTAFESLKKASERLAFLLHGFPEGSQKQLEREIAKVESEMTDLVTGLQTKPLGQWHKLSDLQAKLKANEVFIDIFSLPVNEGVAREYYAWLSTQDQTQVLKLGNATEIDDLIRGFIAHLGQCSNPDFFLKEGNHGTELLLQKQVLQPLSQLILKPIQQSNLVIGKQRWIVCPDMELWNFPWGALLLANGDYAIKKISFRYVISGRDLLKPKQANAVGPAWVMAGPNYNHPPTSKGWKHYEMLKLLADAKNEEKAVVAGLKNNWNLNADVQKDDVTKEALLSLKKSPRIVWLTTHGASPLPTQFKHGDPLFSCGIFFAGSNYLPDAVPANGGSLPGLLTGAEVLGLPLQGTELVVLSACQTGTGKRAYGQSPADLRHAFHLAGAKGVVASLWSVPDKSTQQLMELFIQNRSTFDNADALQMAQIKMIKNLLTSDDFVCSHPFFWAAFTITEQ